MGSQQTWGAASPFIHLTSTGLLSQASCKDTGRKAGGWGLEGLSQVGKAEKLLKRGVGTWALKELAMQRAWGRESTQPRHKIPEEAGP